MKPHKICIILLPITLFIMLLAINSSYSNEVYTIGLLMTIGEFVYLWGYICGIFKEKDDKEKEEEDDDVLSLCIKLIVYTAKYCGCNRIDEATRVKIRKFIIKNDPKHLSSRLEELDNLDAKTSGSNISSFYVFLLCEKTKKKLSHTHNTSFIYSSQKSILDILFTAVYQTNKYNFILEHISKNIGANHLFENIRQEYEKKYNAETETNRETDNKENTEDYLNSQFMTLTLKLLAQAMKVDRSKMVCELDIIKAFIQRYDEKNFQERMSEVKKYLKFDYKELAVEETCKSINDKFSQEYKKREEILKLLIDLIYADETCTNEENIFLEKIAKKLNVSSSSFDFMRMKYENRKKQNEKQDKKQENKRQSKNKSNKDQSGKSQNGSQPKYTSELEKAYAALGIDKDASDKEIRASWRNLIRINHPDLMESKGAEAVMKATVKCQELNKAFEIVKASRGMK